MRHSLLIFLGIISFAVHAFGQDRAKYEIIRETIHFLATDEKVSQDTNFRISCEPLDYDCFTQALSSKPILGIERWYNRWRSMNVTDTAELIALRDRIFADIFERRGKGYRKQLEGYEGYITRTEQAIDRYRNGPEVPITTADTAQAIVGPGAGMNPSDSIQADHTEQTANESDNPEKENPMIAYLALALGLIALTLVLMPLFRKKQTPEPSNFQALSDRIEDIGFRMKRLERQATPPQSQDAVQTLTEIMESVEKRVVELEKQSRSDVD